MSVKAKQAQFRQSRSDRHLTPADREGVSRGLAIGDSARQIARRLGRAASTVSREIARNGGRERYRAASPDVETCRRARRPKAARLARLPALRAVVEAPAALVA
ncbi:helix-turn-helix domain-containing protein [Streptomyces sp. NPDC088748]|uniref:helix-turn-helix domain-containing protein n=1 Tax=Streptomyces sp. NPDC088748 TaxID=3365887 RepID=UPI00382482CF